MGRRGGVTVQSRPKPPGGWPTNVRKITIADVSPKEQGVKAPHQAPQPEGAAPGRLNPRTLGFECQQGLLSGVPEGCRKWRPHSSRTKNTYTLGPRAETVIWKEPGSDPPADLGESPREAGGNIPGDIHTGGSHSGSLFYHVDTGAGKGYFGILHLAYEPQDPALPSPISL